MDTYEFMLRKLQRKEAKQKSEAARRQRQLEESEALLRPHSRPLRFNQAESSTEEEQESAPNHSVPAPRRTQENSRAVARQTGESFPSTVNKNAGQAGKSYSPSAAFHVSCSNSPASSTARANQRLTEDSSDDDDMDLVEVFKARELASIRSTVISSTPPRPTLMDRRIDDSLGSESVHKRKSPRNPFTLSTFHAAKQPPRDVAIKSTNNESDDLWSDSDNNEEPTKKAKTERVPKSLKLLQSRKKRPNEEAERGLNRILPSMKNLEQSLQDITEDEDFNVDLTELKPVFDFPRFGPLDFEPFVLNPGHLGIESPICVPASISRYLPLYQKEGIQFMYNQAVTSGHGAVLGDDMGLGKTVQVIGLLSALLKKKGDGSDLVELIRRKNIARKTLTDFQNFRDDALEQGNVPAMESAQEHLLRRNTLPDWAPILIIAPNSVLKNWVNDFATWGHFSVVEYRGENKESALEQIQLGGAEILLMGKSVTTSEGSFGAILNLKGNVRWKLIIVDEFHQFKTFNNKMANNLRELRNTHTRNVIGLTGTLMQNNHFELWNLVDIVHENFLGSRKEFIKQFGIPIKLGMARNSTPSARKHSEEKQMELASKMPTIYKSRLKENILKDLLPMKDERVVFCEPSALQVVIYKHLIKLPDFDYLRKANMPCECGVNKRFFAEYQRLTSREEKIAYQRQHRDDIIPRKHCCFTVPTPEHLPRAVIWRQNHEKNEPCEKCPYCISLPVLTVLNKLSSHVSLLQVEVPPNQIDQHIDFKKWKSAKQLMEQAELFLPDHLLGELPGTSRVQKNGLMNAHCKLSGKMAVLKKLLVAIKSQGRVLLFSSSTKMLDLIEDFIKSEGHSYLRMDGSTCTTKRNEIVDIFKRDTNSFVFLLSTKAMGLGLNLTEAAFVIIFDVEWNPSWDSQAQDRAYRIGQQKNVQVFRLVTRGTIEELKYLRQVYKTQLTNATIPDVQSETGFARLFDGVADDRYRRGELFGIANLLKFKEGTFMNYATKTESKEMKKYEELKNDMHSVEALQTTLMNASEEEKQNTFLEEENVFPNLTTRKDYNSDPAGSDDEDILGGESQLMLDICNEMEDSDDGSNNHEVHGAEAKDRSPVHVNAHVAEPRLVDHAESTTPDQRKGASDTESISSNNNRKRKQMASNIDMRSAGNYSLVGLSAQNLLKDGFRTSFRMSDFAVPNSRGKPPKK